MAKEPNHRYQTAAEVLQALTPHAPAATSRDDGVGPSAGAVFIQPNHRSGGDRGAGGGRRDDRVVRETRQR